MLSRRSLLIRSAQLGALTQFPGLTLADRDGDARFIVVILRGALDGLAAVPPYGEPQYQPLRAELALPSPGSDDGALKLDALFALHPAMTNMHRLYGAGELAVVHAVATSYRERSHFDGQMVLENGGSRAGQPRDGWLNRAIGRLANDGPQGAIALAQNVPLLLRGDASVASWSPSRLPHAADDTFERIADLYANDQLLAARLREALDAREIAADAPMAASNRRGSQGQLGPLVSAAVRFLSAADGPRIAVLESGGWDTHANQGTSRGLLAARLTGLDNAVDTLQRELGEHWRRTAVVIVTEFGRTVAVNGTRGTDHGTGGCAFLAGGAVRGGRVIADWPGLAAKDLHEGRDLAPTTDLRAVLKGVLRDHLGVAAALLETEVFPETATIDALEDLVIA